jgi:hypothetical protein
MTRPFWTSVLILLAGCESRPEPPAVLKETDLKNRVVLESAEPLDPESVLFTLHKSGLITWKGAPQSKEEMLKRAGTPEKTNRIPILLEVDPDAQFSVVRDALWVLTGKSQCVNYSFLVDTKTGPGAVVLPMQGFKGWGYHVYEGRDKETHLGKGFTDRYLEVVASVGEGGEIKVSEVNYDVPWPKEYENSRGREAPGDRWTGEHPPFGIWTRDTLRTFLSRADVIDLSPYVHLKLTTQELASDVVRCLAALRSIKGITIVPLIPSKE